MVMKPVPAQKGFTLLELMTALAVLGLLLGLAGPGLANFIEESRLSGSSRDFVIDFALARSEAVMRAQRVTVCTSTDGATCANDSWNDGRLVFVDNGTVGTVDAGDLILSKTPALHSSIATTPTGAAAAYFFSYAPSGQLTALGQIQVCAPGHERRVVNIHRSGAATLDREAVVC